MLGFKSILSSRSPKKATGFSRCGTSPKSVGLVPPRRPSICPLFRSHHLFSSPGKESSHGTDFTHSLPDRLSGAVGVLPGLLATATQAQAPLRSVAGSHYYDPVPSPRDPFAGQSFGAGADAGPDQPVPDQLLPSVAGPDQPVPDQLLLSVVGLYYHAQTRYYYPAPAPSGTRPNTPEAEQTQAGPRGRRHPRLEVLIGSPAMLVPIIAGTGVMIRQNLGRVVKSGDRHPCQKSSLC